MQVVQRDQTEPENLLRFDKVPDITAGKLGARRAGAALFDRLLLKSELGVLKIQRSGGGEGSAVARQSRW